MGSLTNSSVRMPKRAIVFLDEMKVKLGMKSRGQVLLFIINVWGDIILAHLDNPLGAASITHSAGTPTHMSTHSAGTPTHMSTHSAGTLTQIRVESAASNLQVKDPRMAKLEAARSKLSTK